MWEGRERRKEEREREGVERGRREEERNGGGERRGREGGRDRE